MGTASAAKVTRRPSGFQKYSMMASKCVDFYPTGLIEPGARQPLHILRPMPSSDPYPSTPDGRYFVVKGRLWRMSNPGLDPDRRQRLVNQLMQARRQVGIAKKAGDPEGERRARDAVDEAKRGLGERGPVWWLDGAPDFNRKLVTNTPYAEWHAAISRK
jgi:hypothetical protein